MNRIADAISHLLYDQEKVIVPGLGAFIRALNSAKVNIVTNQFTKPSSTLLFDPQQREDNDLIVAYLITKEGISEEEGRQLLARFVSDCFTRFKEGEKVILEGVGTLFTDAQQKVCFEAAQTSDYNGDAFGLCDFSPQPVFTSSKQDDWREQVARQIKDKNTPMTVDSQRVRRNFESEEDRKNSTSKRSRKLWIPLLALLLLGGIFVLLAYLKLIPVELPFMNKPQPVVYHTPGKPIDPELQKQLFSYYVYQAPEAVADTLVAELDTSAMSIDTVVEPVVSEVTEPVVTEPAKDTYLFEPPETAKVFIIGGCYSMQENAVTQIKTVREQGFEGSFVMKRGSKYYVCYGHFATTEEAKEMLAKVRPYNAKAWLLTKK